MLSVLKSIIFWACGLKSVRCSLVHILKNIVLKNIVLKNIVLKNIVLKNIVLKNKAK